MRRFTPDELRMRLAVQLTVLPPYARRALQLQGEAAVNAAVGRLMERVFDDVIVLIPDPVLDAMHQRPGKFGVTEPDPFPFSDYDLARQSNGRR